MKANLSRSVTGKGPFHGHDIRLTIGLIVKNEEKTLEKCLDALQPLMDAVPSELIITDTGSTDSTVEIAQRYTDHIIHFEWCDDFAAARNTGLHEARGEWFMFLDGDEWFEDTTEIIDFFNSGECDEYGSASYIVRNYSDFAGTDYVDTSALRIFRIQKDVDFHGPIHEDILPMKPTKAFYAFEHHYGYAYHNEAERLEKHRRNLELLEKAIQQEPDNLKNYYQICGQYYSAGDTKQGLHYCIRGLEREKDHPDKLWKKSLLHMLFRGYVTFERYEELLSALSDFLECDHEDTVYHMDFYRIGQKSAFRLEQFDLSAEYGKRYLELYQKFENGELDRTLLMYSVFIYVKPKYREKALLDLARCYLNLNQPENALKYLRKADISVPDSWSLKEYFQIWFDAADLSEDWSVAAESYQKLLNLDDRSLLPTFYNFSEEIILQYPRKGSAIVRAFADLSGQDAYVMLNRLRTAEYEQNHTEACEILEWFAQSEEHWNELYSDVLYFAMKEQTNIMPYLMRLDTDELPYFSSNIFKQHSNFVQIIPEYFNTFSFDNMKGLFWSNCLKERAVLAQKDPEDEKAYLTLFEDYARQTAAYVRKLYRPEMFSSANLAALPRAHRFGYYMGEAFTAQKRGNDAAYLENLRLALKSYPIMEKPIGMLLERFEKEQKRERDKAEEFQKLAQKVKEQIESLIADDRLEEAGKITAQLAELLPNDEDVIRYRMLTHTEPTMREIAAKLPQ